MDNENNDLVILELDRPRELKLTHKVLKRFCAATGTKLSDIDSAVEDYAVMTRLIYEMLRANDEKLTPAQCDDLLDAVPIGTILQKGALAVRAGFGDNDKAEAGTADPPRT